MAKRVWPSALITSALVFLEVQLKLFGEEAEAWELALATFALFLTLLILEGVRELITNRRFAPLLGLQRILDDVTLTGTAFEWASLETFVDSVEERIDEGGSATILSGSISDYDHLRTARRAIERNLLQGARYTYLIPGGGEHLRTLRELIEMLFDDLVASGLTPTAARRTLLDRISAAAVIAPILNSFGILRFSGTVSDTDIASYWYMTACDATNSSAVAVIYAKLSASQIDQLSGIIQQLSRSSRKISISDLLDGKL